MLIVDQYLIIDKLKYLPFSPQKLFQMSEIAEKSIDINYSQFWEGLNLPLTQLLVVEEFCQGKVNTVKSLIGRDQLIRIVLHAIQKLWQCTIEMLYV